MEILATIIFISIFLLAPAAVKAFCKKHKWADKIGAVLILYILGIIIGNLRLLPFLPAALAHPSSLPAIQDALSSAMVPIAIPLLLLRCNFRLNDTRSQLLALATGTIAVLCAVVCGYFIFRGGIDAMASDSASSDSAANIGGMLMGVYTGGTINLAAIKSMLGVSERTYLLLNSCDMIISFLFLTLLLSFGIRFLRRFLPFEAAALQSTEESASIAANDGNDGKAAFFRRGQWKQLGLLFLVTVAIVGVSAGISLLLPEGWFMTAFILLLTSLGIAASFSKRLSDIKIAEDISMYCIYIFSIVVASMADLSALDLSSSLSMLGYLSFVVFCSLLIQVLLAKLLRIDADTIVIASTAFICSPPFVPMMAAAMKNRRVLVGGLTIGIIGYAMGNYLGFLVSRLLLLL
ncbi:MAG: DUF819 family protein [Bacteroidales bacterium]|nr:DUF819 family protein [Bacteroidales bacterium]